MGLCRQNMGRIGLRCDKAIQMAKTVTLTIDWRQAELDMPENLQERQTEALLQDLAVLDGVEQVDRVADPDVPDGGMGAAWLWSILTAKITVDGLKQIGKEVQERLPGKPIEFTIKSGEKEVTVKNLRPDDLDATLEKLVAAAKELAED